MTVKEFLQLFSPVPAGTWSLGVGWRSVACSLVLKNCLKVIKVQCRCLGAEGEENSTLWKQHNVSQE